jgi:hypothetical protein
MSGVHKAKPILTNQTVPEILLRKFDRKQAPASSETNPTTHSAGAPARQFPTSNPQTRRSLTVSSRRGLPARGLLKRGPTFRCGGRYRRPQRAPIRARPCSGPPRSRAHGGGSRTPERRRLRIPRRRRNGTKAEGGSARGGAPASGGGASGRRRKKRRRMKGEEGKKKCG